MTIVHDLGVPDLSAALKAEPERGDLACALAEAYRASGAPLAGLTVIEEFLTRVPDYYPALRCQAELLAAVGRVADAVMAARMIMALRQPARAFVHAYGGWLSLEGDHIAAAEALTAHLRYDLDDAQGWLQLGEVWAAVQEWPKAERAWARYRSLVPTDTAQTLVRLARGSDRANLSPDYVRALFDSYAPRFDQELQQILRYQAPVILRDALAAHGGLNAEVIIDAGCGTGLMAQSLGDGVAQRLIGIDLAPRMLVEAAKTGRYSELIAGDMIEVLASRDWHADVMIAADVLVYLGDLVPFWQAAARALREGGRLAVTVEAIADEQDWILKQPQRRYGHSANYLRRLALAHGFSVRLLAPCIPRYESGVPVNGFVFVGQKIN